MNKKITLLTIIVTVIFFEFLRDYIFINTNLQIKYTSDLEDGFNSYNYTDSTISLIINNLSLHQLNISKWLMTLFFFLIYVILGGLIALNVWGKKKTNSFIKIYFSGGMTIFFLSLFFYLVSISLKNGSQYDFYLISIELSHFVQSSLYPISFLLIFYYYLKIKPKY